MMMFSAASGQRTAWQGTEKSQPLYSTGFQLCKCSVSDKDGRGDPCPIRNQDDALIILSHSAQTWGK